MEKVTTEIKRFINGTEDKVGDNLSRAAEDIRAGVHDARENVGKATNNITSAVHDAACEVGEAGVKTMHDLKKQSDCAVKATGEYIQRNPVQCALGGLALGFVLSKFLFKR